MTTTKIFDISMQTHKTKLRGTQEHSLGDGVAALREACLTLPNITNQNFIIYHVSNKSGSKQIGGTGRPYLLKTESMKNIHKKYLTHILQISEYLEIFHRVHNFQKNALRHCQPELCNFNSSYHHRPTENKKHLFHDFCWVTEQSGHIPIPRRNASRRSQRHNH